MNAKVFLANLMNNAAGIVLAGDGKDTLHGSKANDHLFGQGGNDAIYAGAGDDLLELGAYTATAFVPPVTWAGLVPATRHPYPSLNQL